MRSVMVVGGGLSGLAAAAALGSAGYCVDLYEARPFFGGRATSYAVTGSDGISEVIDNCQHILLRCCVNLLDFYTRLGVGNRIAFHREFYFVEPGGRISVFQAGSLPVPAHFTGSFLKLRFLNWREKLALIQGILALQRESRTRRDLDQITMLAWLTEKRQPARVVERFWRQILVSAVNEELDRMAAQHGFQVFLLGFLAHRDSYEMGVPTVPLAELYSAGNWSGLPNVRLHSRSTVTEFGPGGGCVNGQHRTADFYISAVPADKLQRMGMAAPQFEPSPITGIHLWFDRPVTDLPHATLLDRTIQWMFNKQDGRHIQLVVSASRSLLALSRAGVIELALQELAEFFPAVRHARVVKAHVVKEIHATFSAATGLDSLRPATATEHPNVFLAGDWTRTGWPATMEGAVRSGYAAAEAVTRAAGDPRRFVI